MEVPAADTTPPDNSAPDVKARAKKPKYTYMLHDPEDMTSLGKYVSTDYRYAALKVVSRWHKKGLRRILLRRTNSKEIHEFEGSVTPLDKPKVIRRAGQEIMYHHRPDVKFIKAWTFETSLPTKARRPRVTGLIPEVTDDATVTVTVTSPPVAA